MATHEKDLEIAFAHRLQTLKLSDLPGYYFDNNARNTNIRNKS